MAKQSKRKNLSVVERIEAWVKSNQKVIFVVLLIIIAPTFAMTGIFSGSLSYNSGQQVLNTVFGEDITKADYELAAVQLGHVGGLIVSGFVTTFTPLPGVLGDSELSYPSESKPTWARLDPAEYYALTAKARSLGIHVSDVELSRYIRELWRRAEAVRRAAVQLQSDPQSADPSAQANLWSRRIELTRRNIEELGGAEGTYFDQVSWAKIVERGSGRNRMRVRDFEEALRNVVLIAKLEAYVKDTVQVSPEKVFEKYNKDKQTRKVSWAEFAVPPELGTKVGATLTDDEVRAFFEEDRQAFKKANSLRGRWLLLSTDHFKAEATKKITEETLKEYFHSHRNYYRRPDISRSEARFALRTVDEMEATQKERFKEFDDVKDDVREKVIEDQTDVDIRAFRDALGLRLHPRDKGAAVPTFEEIVAESPFLETGKTAYAPEDEAEEAFGRGYGPQVTRWFAALRSARPVAPTQGAVLGDQGYVFYTDVETRPGNYVPLFSEIEGEVRESLTSNKAATLVEEALKVISSEINDGGKTFDAAVTAGLDVEVGGEAVHIGAAPVATSKTFIGKNGPLMVAKTEEPASEDGEPSAAVGEDDEGEDAEPAEEAHAASAPILTAAFSIPDDKVGHSAMAADEDQTAGYLVRSDALRLPNPSGFAKDQGGIGTQLQREEQRLYFAAWKLRLMKEALPPSRGLPVDSSGEPEAAEESTAAEG